MNRADKYSEHDIGKSLYLRSRPISKVVGAKDKSAFTVGAVSPTGRSDKSDASCFVCFATQNQFRAAVIPYSGLDSISKCNTH